MSCQDKDRPFLRITKTSITLIRVCDDKNPDLFLRLTKTSITLLNDLDVAHPPYFATKTYL